MVCSVKNGGVESVSVVSLLSHFELFKLKEHSLVQFSNTPLLPKPYPTTVNGLSPLYLVDRTNLIELVGL